MTVPRAEKAYEKHAWVIFSVIGAFGLISTLGPLIGGTPYPGTFERFSGTTWSQFSASNPKIAVMWSLQTRGVYLIQIITGVLFIGVSLKSYRRGEKWAWYALWIVPITSGISIPVDLLPEYAAADLAAGAAAEDALFVILSLVGLLLPYRKFFPRK